MRRERALLLVVAHFPPKAGGGVIRATKLVKHLARLGWHSTVLTKVDDTPHPYDASLLHQVPAGSRVLRIAEPFGVRTTAGPGATISGSARPSRPSFVPRALRALFVAIYGRPDRLITWALRAAFARELSSDRPEVVISSGPPHSAHIAGVLLSSRLSVPFVIDLRDEWSPNPFFRRASAPGRAVERALEGWCLRRADAIILVTQPSLERYRRHFPSAAQKMALIPNGFDPDDLPDPLPTPVQGDLVFAYAGSLLMKRDGRSFFEAFSRAVAIESAALPPRRLLLMGTFRHDQEATARSLLPAERLEILPYLPQRQALERLAASHALIMITGPEEGGDTAVAGKLYEYLALKRPILVVAPEGSVASRLVIEWQVGAAGDPLDPAALDDAIAVVTRLALDPSFQGAPADVIAHYDRSNQATTWDRLLRALTSRTSAIDS